MGMEQQIFSNNKKLGITWICSKMIFFILYQGKAPLNQDLGEYFFPFSKHLKQIPEILVKNQAIFFSTKLPLGHPNLRCDSRGIPYQTCTVPKFALNMEGGVPEPIVINGVITTTRRVITPGKAMFKAI